MADKVDTARILALTTNSEARAVVAFGLALATSHAVSSLGAAQEPFGVKTSLLTMLVAGAVMFLPALLHRFRGAVDALLRRIGPACLFLGAALLLVATTVGSEPFIAVVSAAASCLIGVGYSTMALRCAQVFIASPDFRRTAACIALGYAVCSIVTLAAMSVPETMGGAVVAALLVLSFFVAPPMEDGVLSDPPVPVWGTEHREGRLVSLLLFLWLGCLVAAALLFSTFILAPSLQEGVYGVAVPAISAGVSPLLVVLFLLVFHLVVIMQVKDPFSVRYQAATLVVLAGFFAVALLAFANIELHGLLAALMWVCRMFCQCLTLVVAIDVARRCGRQPLAVYGVVVGVLHVSTLFVGGLADDMGTHGMGALALVVGYCLTAGSMLLPRVAVNVTFSKDVATMEGSRQGTRLDALAASKGLSPREREVLGYLAQGRSIPYIKEILVVSESTVKTHVTRIYRKLGVHSRQELIDLAEEHPRQDSDERVEGGDSSNRRSQTG